MQVAPYLFFDGCCEEALAFYEEALGAEVVTMMRFAEAPPSDGPSMQPPGSEQKIMHAAFRIGGAELMASDGMCAGRPASQRFQGFSVSLTVPDVGTAERLFGALSAGGEVRQPLTETFFAPRFGMVADKFGLGWMIVVEAAGTA